MQQLLAYGMMALVIAALCLVYFWKNRSTHAMGDRFGLLFLEARDYAARQQTAKAVLVDGAQLAALLMEYDLGVSTEAVYAVKRVDTDFFAEG